MNLLIVDDEKLAVNGIMSSVTWDRLNFENVFVAYSSEQAKKIFEQEEVSVLLCDIEMPGGNGIELVMWVKNKSPKTICIFLTCHVEIDFAIQAVQLQCMDYVLKPVKPQALMNVLQKAVALYDNNEVKQNYEKYGYLFMKNIGEAKQESVEDISEKVEEYIRQNLMETELLTVEYIAEHFYVSAGHLTRLFKKKYNKTIIDYIIDQRMFLAKELLEKDDLSISIISTKVGYDNYSYFSRIYKKYYGISPSEYQRKFRSLNKK